MTTAASQTAAAAGLPLFYRTPVVLRFEDHRRAGLGRALDFNFTREATAVQLMISEFMPALRHYPIVFSDSERPVPLAVLGLKQGRNLFLEDNGSWRADTYVPAYVRRYPFIITETPDPNTRLLSIDAASERFVETLGEGVAGDLLFESGGGPTQATRAAMEFCQAMHEDHLRTVAFSDALRGAELLTSNRADITFPNGDRYTLDGFRTIDEKAYRALATDKVAEWHKSGALDLVAMHLASQRNWQILLDLNAAQAEPQSAAA